MGSHPFLDDLSHQRGRSDSPGVGGCFEFSLDVQIETYGGDHLGRPPLPYHFRLVEQGTEVVVEGELGRLGRRQASEIFTLPGHDVCFLHICRSFMPASRAPTMVQVSPSSTRVQTTRMSRCSAVGAQTARKVGLAEGTRLSILSVAGA